MGAAIKVFDIGDFLQLKSGLGTLIFFENRNFEFFRILIILHPQPQNGAMGDAGRNFGDLIENSKSRFSMRIRISAISSQSGTPMA